MPKKNQWYYTLGWSSAWGQPGWADGGEDDNDVNDGDDDYGEDDDDVNDDGGDDDEDGDVLGDNLGGLMASILRSEFSRGQPLY